MQTFSGNIGQINAKILPTILEWLDKHNVPYDEIIVGKPWCGNDGYLEVFEGEGDNWSFVMPKGIDDVAKTTQKDRISSLCSSGLYYFNHASDFMTIFKKSFKTNKKDKGEFYIAPLYNELISQGKSARVICTQENQKIYI